MMQWRRKLSWRSLVQSWAALVKAKADTGAAIDVLAKIKVAAAVVGSLEIEEEEEDKEEEERSLLIQQEAETIFFSQLRPL